MKSRYAALLVALAGLSPMGLAQVERPKFFVWSSGGHPYAGTSQSPLYVETPNLKCMVRPWNDLSDPDHHNDPELLAVYVAKEVHKRVTSSGPDHINPGEVAFSFWTFGRAA